MKQPDYAPLGSYNLVDFKAILRHALNVGKDADAIYCDETDQDIPTWRHGAQKLLELYFEAWFGNGNSPRELLVAHDMGHKYRTAVFEGYKQKRNNRAQSPVAVEQKAKLEEWCKAFFAAVGATQIGVEGVEADDIIAWLCQGIQYHKNVFSVDQDLLQLVNDDTFVYLKLEPHLPGGENKDIPYHLTSISKSIIGDTSDCYGGVAGVGVGKFMDLLAKYGEDGIIQLRDAVETGDTTPILDAVTATGDKTLQKLLDQFGEWRQMYKLAQLHPELCWKPRAKKLVKPIFHKRMPNPARLKQLLTDAGADDMWDQFEPMMPRSFAIDATNWEDMREAIKGEIELGDVTPFDYETFDPAPNPAFVEAASRDSFVDMLSQEVTGASFQFGRHLENAIYLTVNHKDSANLPKDALTELLEHAAENSTLIAHNAYFEQVVTRTNLHVELSNVHDTRVLMRCIDENDEAGLKHLSKRFLGYTQKTYEETVGDKGHMANLTLEEVFGYGVDDALTSGYLYDLFKLMAQLDGCWNFYHRWMVNPTTVLVDSYVNGVDVDWELQENLHRDDIANLEQCHGALRKLLEEHVDGSDESGALSLYEADKEFVMKSYRRKLRNEGKLSADEQAAEVRSYMARHKAKLTAAARYVPYRVEEVMPSFSPTPKQLSEAAVAIGLPPLDKATQTYLNEYLIDQGMVGFGAEPPEDPKQREFLVALKGAIDAKALSLTSLQNQLKKAQEAEEDDKVAKAADNLSAAQEALEALGEVVQRIAGVEPKRIASGDELSLGSPQQMQQLLYCKLGVPVRLFGKSSQSRMMHGVKQGAPSADEKAILTAIANDVGEGQEWKKQALELLLKAKSSLTKISLYHQKYPLWKHHRDGKIHPSFMVAGTDTRRPTGSAPNVLQVSKKDKMMRQQFVPPGPDWVVVPIDYASQEIRIMACEAKDEVMMSVYEPGNEKDLHSMTGTGIALKTEPRLANVTYDDFVRYLEDEGHELHPLVKAIRGKKAKGTNFGMAYGAAAPTLSRNLIVPIGEAQEMLDSTMQLYWRIPEWQKEQAKFMETYGYTLTAFGMKRHATDDIFSKKYGEVTRQHRQGTNATIQGTAADMLHIVLTKIHERGLLKRLRMVFFAPVYDETVAFVHKDDVLEYCREMRDIMGSATPPGHQIPQVPEFSIGATWGSCRELGRWQSDEQIQAGLDLALADAEKVWERIREAA